jgi:hypothetical protein
VALKREALVCCLVLVVLATVSIAYLIERPPALTPESIFVLVETTVTFVGLIYVLFVSFAWHWKLFRKWLVRVPDFRGTWRGTVTPVVQGHESPQINARLIIRQSLFVVVCILETDNMTSRSFSGAAYYDENTDEPTLIYSYSSDPLIHQRETNPRHDGTAIFRLRDADTVSLTGRYFTDRCTRGSMDFLLTHDKVKRGK